MDVARASILILPLDALELIVEKARNIALWVSIISYETLNLSILTANRAKPKNVVANKI